MESHLSQLTPVIGGEWDMLFRFLPGSTFTALPFCPWKYFENWPNWNLERKNVGRKIHLRSWFWVKFVLNVAFVHQLGYCLPTDWSIICPPIGISFVHQFGHRQLRYYSSTNRDIREEINGHFGRSVASDQCCCLELLRGRLSWLQMPPKLARGTF